MSQPNAQPNPEVLDEIVHLEWQMLQQINVGGPRAGCQDDPTTFKAMRTGQFANWSAAAAGAYLDDLRQAIASGRNLVAEKYVNMMILESPALRATYASMASAPSPRAQDTAARILHILLAQN
ncbi:MAG: DUF4125 family protein, partial [Mediterranea sp.]|nr:DUF4125 family protein [Mediterranea sp.]